MKLVCFSSYYLPCLVVWVVQVGEEVRQRPVVPPLLALLPILLLLFTIRLGLRCHPDSEGRVDKVGQAGDGLLGLVVVARVRLVQVAHGRRRRRRGGGRGRRQGGGEEGGGGVQRQNEQDEGDLQKTSTKKADCFLFATNFAGVGCGGAEGTKPNNGERLWTRGREGGDGVFHE